MALALHPGGQKTALIVRAAGLGVHIGAVDFLKRIAAALNGVKSLQSLIGKMLAKTYVSDETDAKKTLEAAGYKVVTMTSADYEAAGKLDQFKADILAKLAEKDTTVFVFYGHGYEDGVVVVGDRENKIPGPAEVKAYLEGRTHSKDFISAEDVKKARGGNGLDAYITHACYGGARSYLADRGVPPGGVAFAEAVKPDGFFAGWVTYAIFLEPRSGPILEEFFCHMLRKAQGGAAVKPARHYLRNCNKQARKLGALIGLEDEKTFKGLTDKITLADVDRDPGVHENAMGPEIEDEGFGIILDFLYGIKKGPDPIAKDLRTFVRAYSGYAAKHGIKITVGNRDVAQELAGASTDAQINAMLASSGKDLMRHLVSIAMPGQAFVQEAQLALQPGSDAIVASLDLSVSRGHDVERVLKLVSDSKSEWASQQLAGLPAGAPGLKPIGPELAERVGSTLDAVRAALPDSLAALRLKFELEKRTSGSEHGIVPRVLGYNIAVGAVPDGVRNAESYPYQIHASVDAVGGIAKTLLNGMFGNEVEIKKNIDFGLTDADVYAFVKIFDVGALSASESGELSLPIRWQVRVNWGPFGDGFGYVDTVIRTQAGFKDDLTLVFAPSMSFQLGNGFPRIGRDTLSRLIEGKLNASIAANAATRWELGSLVPESYRKEVVGHVKIAKLGVANGTLSVHFAKK